MTSIQKSKSNFLLMMSLVGVLAVGSSAVFLSQNNRVNLNSGASNVEQSMNGTLVKRGSLDFSYCKNVDLKYKYALLDDKKVCWGLVTNSSEADKFVNKYVVVKGSSQNKLFYVTSILNADKRVPSKTTLPKKNPMVPPPMY